MSADGAVAQLTIEALGDWLRQRFTSLQAFADALMADLDLDAHGHVEVNQATRRRLKAVAVSYLSENLVVDGCGLIFAHSALGTDNGRLDWWVREDESRFARYSFGVVPGGDRYYDYEHHEWFIRAFHDGVPTIVGPYIDYLGIEAYVLTLTVPCELRGRRIGAIGNDIQVRDLEAELLPLLVAQSAEMALLGQHRTVILSNTSKFLPGEYVPERLPGFTDSSIEPVSAGLILLHPDRA